jgi:hypothetical protein
VLLGARRPAGAQRLVRGRRAVGVDDQAGRHRALGISAPASDDLDALSVEAHEAGDVGPQQLPDLAGDDVEQLALRRLRRDQRRDAPQRRLLLGEHAVEPLALAQRALVGAALDLRGGARREDPQRGEVLLPRVERCRRQHAQVSEMGAVRAAQRDSEVAVEAALDDHLVIREALDHALRVGDDLGVADLRARGARHAVLDWLCEGRALPAGKEPGPVTVLWNDLGDEGDVGAERQREVLDEALEELLADRPGGPGGDEPQQVLCGLAPLGRLGCVDRTGHHL